MDKATALKFYVKGNGSTKSAAASTLTISYADAKFTGLTPETTYTFYAEATAADGTVVKSSEGTFTTKAQEAQLASKGWLELPAQSSVSTADEYTFSASGERNYTAYYDTGTYSSLWVAFPLTDGHMGSLSRPGWDYAPDNIIPHSNQVNLSSSYSGYSRGHQIANGDRNGIREMQKQTFYYINSVPQLQNGFNGTIWATLENSIRAEASSTDSLYIVTGPVYQTVGGSETCKYTSTSSDSNKRIPVANYFFKVVLKVKRSGDVITDAETVGFWFEHKNYDDNNFEKYAVTVDEIERKTGFDFFANLPDDIEAKAEQNANWSTFCSF